MRKFSQISFLGLSLVFSLVSCKGNGGEKIQKTPLLFGTKEFVSQEVDSLSHMKKLEDESVLQKMIAGKDNFVLIVMGRGETGSHSTCGCWNRFHEQNIVSFQREFNFLFYYIYSDQLTSSLGLSLGVEKATIGIFKDGELVAQNNDADEVSPFYTSYEVFKTWMLNRIELPRVFFVNKEQLDSLYAGSQEFTIYFSRQRCGDCSYLQRGLYSSWYESHLTGVQDSYIIDCDAPGIASIVDEDGQVHYRDEDSEYGKAAAEQYNAFKVEYGLAYSSYNPAGYSQGVFPTIFHVNPDGVSKTGDVIDASGVFFNETIQDGKVTESYFDGSRDNLEIFSYLNKVEKKNLVGVETSNNHEGLEECVKPLLNALLDYCVGEAK